MAKHSRKKPGDHALRRQAEERLRERMPDEDAAQVSADTARLLHELQVHQIELEMQNEELRLARTEAETALAKFVDLYDFAPVGYLTLTRDGIIQAVNFLGAGLLESERSRLLGRPFDVFVLEECRPALNTFLKQAFSMAGGASCEVTLAVDDELPRVVRIAATASPAGDECRMVVVDISQFKEDESALIDMRDRLEKVVAERTADLAEANIRLQHDIAEREQAEASLRESEERYRRLLASITSYVYRVDILDGAAAHTEHGEGCQAVTGYTPEEYAENDLLWIAMIPDEDRPAVLDAMARIVDARMPITIEHRIVHQSGELHWIRNTLVPHRDGDDALTSYDGIVTDITERKRHETERARLELEALQGEKLRALGQLAAAVAHEVRNPLNAIVISVEMLSKKLRDKQEFNAHLERVRRQVGRLNNLMKDLLELRRPEEARNRQRRTVASLCRMAVDIWSLSNEEPRYPLATELAPEADCAEVMVDPERVVQVIINLLDNAAQHSDAEREILLSATGANDGCAAIRVRDQGKGIPEEYLQRAFEPFFTTRKGGSGLGLSIAKHIIESYFGRITIRNNVPPPGCTVEILLPVVPATPA